MLAHALPLHVLREHAQRWLAEDAPALDCAGAVVGARACTAEIRGKSDGLLAGVPFVDQVFSELRCRVEWVLKEGEEYSGTPESPAVLARVAGPANRLLLGERVALNVLARAGGVAARARLLARLTEEHGFKGVVAGTRKTTPGLRVVEKYAMLVGGIDTHRMDLSAMVMIKDNHLAVGGGGDRSQSIADAVSRARRVAGFSTKIEVECAQPAQAAEALQQTDADIVMLDNFTAEQLGSNAVQAALALRRPGQLVEASGGIAPDNIAAFFAVPGVNIVSSSWVVTGGEGHPDLSLVVVSSSRDEEMGE